MLHIYCSSTQLSIISIFFLCYFIFLISSSYLTFSLISILFLFEGSYRVSSGVPLLSILPFLSFLYCFYVLS